MLIKWLKEVTLDGKKPQMPETTVLNNLEQLIAAMCNNKVYQLKRCIRYDLSVHTFYQ